MRAACSSELHTARESGCSGSPAARTATFAAPGTACLRSSKFLPASSGPTKENPVSLPAGRARLSPKPEPTGMNNGAMVREALEEVASACADYLVRQVLENRNLPPGK
jgi:hypothetical protein